MIRDLQTKLGHERLAKDEALDSVRRLETETHAAVQVQQAVEAELTAERLARRNAEDALAEALEARQEAEPSHGLAVATRTKQKVPASLDTGAEPDANGTAWPTVPARKRKRRMAAGAPDTSIVKTDSGHLGPVCDDNQESDIVEWWKPGWRDDYG